MFISITTTTEHRSGPEVEINCPGCGGFDVLAGTRQQTQRLHLYGLIPIQRVTTTIVTCGACGLELQSRIGVDQIAEYSARDLDLLLTRKVSFVVKFLALASLLLFWAPIVGLTLSVIALACSFRKGGWTKTMSFVSVLLSGLVTTAFVAMLVLAPDGFQ
jgi:transcription elongation factor Elf1